MLNKISLINFKCFADQQFSLNSLNLLTGLNGMGKSSLIQSLLLLRQNHDRNTLYKRLSLNGDLFQCGNVSDVLYQYMNRPELGIELQFNNKHNYKWLWNGQSQGDSLELIDHEPKDDDHVPSLSGFSLFNKRFHYLNAERIGPRPYFETSSQSVLYDNQLGIRGEFAAHFLSVFRDEPIPIKEISHPEASSLTLYDQVNAWMGEIRPGTRIDINQSDEMGLVSLRYQFIAGLDQGNKFRSTNVGFGISYILPLLVAILFSKPGTLLLLENPEAHLHPHGQAQMGRFLALAAAYGVQIIVESHSDHILNGIRVAVKEGALSPDQANLLFFTGDVIEGKFTHYIETPKIDRNGKLDYRPEGFFDEWDRQLTQLI